VILPCGNARKREILRIRNYCDGHQFQSFVLLCAQYVHTVHRRLLPLPAIMWRVEILFRGRWCPVVIVLLCRIWHGSAVAVPRPWLSILPVVHRYRLLSWIARLPAHIPSHPVVHNSNSGTRSLTQDTANRDFSSTLLWGETPKVDHYTSTDVTAHPTHQDQ
jgi:hypothetical protein